MNTEISIIDVFLFIKKKFKYLIILPVIFAIVTYVFLAQYSKPTYVYKGSMIVNSYNDASTLTPSQILQNYSLSINIIPTYIEVFKSETYLNYILQQTGLDSSYSTAALRNMINYTYTEDNNIFYFTVSSKNNNDAKLIAETISSTSPTYSKDYVLTAKVSVVDQAAKSQEQLYNKNVVSAFVFFTSFILVNLIAYFIDINDKRIKSESKIASKYQLPVLATIPNFSLSSKGKKAKTKSKNRDISYEIKTNLLSENSSFFVKEAYKSARTNLNFSLSTISGCRKIVVTSAYPGEGKTTTSINLAISIAQTNARVLIIDADLRKSMIHNFLGLKNINGLSNVLGGFTQLDDVIKKTHLGFDCMSAGPTPPNPAELLNSPIMDDLLTLLSKHYDYIIIDTPPITIISDALALVDKTSGFLLAVRQGVTTFDKLDQAVFSLNFAKAKILGVFYNDADDSTSHYSYSKYAKSNRYYYSN